ncbi:MAG: hypothetical protein RL418_609 [Actinomycetota bacterium]
MTFYDVPLKVESNPKENATDLLLQRVAKNPNHALFSRQNPDKSWRDVTAGDFLAEVKSLATSCFHKYTACGRIANESRR